MRISFLTIAVSSAALLCHAASLPPTHFVHERRDVAPSNWVKRSRIAERSILPMRIGLKQSNLHNGYDLLMDVSDPESPNFGKHKTQEEVIEIFKPSDETVEEVFNWLTGSGIAKERITHSDNKGWLAFDATNKEAEELLHTKYHEYEHLESGSVVPACDEYHLPKNIQKHVDYVTPGLRLLAVGKGQNLRRDVSKNLKPSAGGVGDLPPKFLPVPIDPIHLASTTVTTPACDKYISPGCIRDLYHVPLGTKAISSNRLGIAEFGNSFAQADLDEFNAAYFPLAPPGFSPRIQLIDGGVAPVAQASAGFESDLDFELAVPIIYPQSTVLYQSAGEGSFNTFLDSIDGSYCTYSDHGETGNLAGVDPMFPDSVYSGKLMCGTYKPTNVISVSYSYQESDLPAYYEQRQCDEYMKLGLQGHTVIYSSGDNGVGGRQDVCIGPSKNAFSPGFPMTCPYVTTVGATKIMPGKTVNDPEWAVVDPINNPYPFAFSSGGGFSNVFPIPSYQSKAVSNYLTNHKPPYKSYSIPGTGLGHNGGVYNRLGRGFPDVAANGDNILVQYRGSLTSGGGTSASAPIFASIINRINEERLANGKKPVGFVNPTLYANPGVLNDITNGSNPGCGTSGFQTQPGWDPVSGLGTPNYPKMLALFMGLP